jgi:hypothetical protein
MVEGKVHVLDRVSLQLLHQDTHVLGLIQPRFDCDDGGRRRDTTCRLRGDLHLGFVLQVVPQGEAVAGEGGGSLW